jgi:hypothetical protein
MIRVLCVLLLGMPLVAPAAPWVADVPEHRLGCAAAPISATDPAAINTAGAVLMTQFATEKLVPGAAEPAPGATPTTIRLCYQLGFGKLDTESVMTLVTVPTTPAILIQCAIVELSNCKSSLDAILGTTWTGRIYAVSIYRWSDGSGKLVDDPPQACQLFGDTSGDTLFRNPVQRFAAACISQLAPTITKERVSASGCITVQAGAMWKKTDSKSGSA